jgi:ATP-dependent DNA helicase RecQ
LPADTLTLYGADDIRLRRSQIDEGLAEDQRKDADHGRLNALLGLAEARGCRRKVLLTYFGDDSADCGNCDLCEKPPEIFDGTEPVRMALSAILRSGEYFGAGHIIDILRGALTDKVRAKGHDQLSTFGIGKAFDQRQWQAILRQMMGHDLIRPDMSRFGALRMNQTARKILRGEETIELRRDTIDKAPRNVRVKALVREEDEPLLSALKAKRRALAEAMQAPAYVVFPDRTLIAMAEVKPKDLDAFSHLPGVGAVKLERYGASFLEVINGASETVHPARRKLAGRNAGSTFDQLQEVQLQLQRGPDGTLKPMTCSASVLAKIAAARPRDLKGIEDIAGAKYRDRFGDAFLEVLNDN